jgi:hypothetical protein
MDARKPPVLRAGGSAPERLQQRGLGALRLFGRQSRPELRAEQDPGGHARSGGASNGSVRKVPVGKQVPSEAPGRDFAGSNAVRQFALEAAAACEEAPKVLVLRHQAQVHAMAKIQLGHLAVLNPSPQPSALLGGGGADQLHYALGLAGRKVHGEAKAFGGLHHELRCQDELPQQLARAVGAEHDHEVVHVGRWTDWDMRRAAGSQPGRDGG